MVFGRNFGGLLLVAACSPEAPPASEDAGLSSPADQSGAGGASGMEPMAPPAAPPSSMPCGSATSHSGEATYYDFADGSGNCGFPATPDDLLVAAVNQQDYAGSGSCGGCARVSGPQGEVTVRLVDRCPECPAGHLDFAPEAFSRLAPLSQGRVSITWQYSACDVSGPLRYRFKEGSNQWWTAIQIRNHRYRVAKLEYRSDGAFIEVPRLEYNYFVAESGMGPGPYTLRVTDVYGHTLVDSGIEHREAGEVAGASQFPACDPEP